MTYSWDASDEPDPSTSLSPERVRRLHAGNREPGVEARLLFPGWGPKLWEKGATLEPKPREQQYGGS